MATLYKWQGGSMRAELEIQDNITLEIIRTSVLPSKEYSGWMTETTLNVKRTIWQPGHFKANSMDEAQEILIQMATEHAIKKLCEANLLLTNLLNANASNYAAQSAHNQNAIDTMREVNQSYIRLAEAAPARPGDRNRN